MHCPFLAPLLTAQALAHYPHDVAAWVARSPGPEPRLLITTIAREEAWYVARSENMRDFAVRYVMDGEGCALTSGRLLDEQLLLVGTDGRGLLISEDAGDSFETHGDIPSDALVNDIEASSSVLEDGLVLAVGSGIWLSEDGGRSWERRCPPAAAPLIDVDLSPDWSQDGRAAAVDGAGGVLLSDDWGWSWSFAGQAPGWPAQVSLGQQRNIWLATLDQGLWHSEDGGQSWDAASLDVPQVAVVEDLGSGLVLAAGTTQAVWRSEDGGSSWSLRAQYLEEPEHDQPSDDVHYFEIVQDHPGDLYLASWEGPARSEDGGRTWIPLETEGPWNIRSLTLSRDDDGSLVALLGTYGSGITLVGLELDRAQAVSRALSKPYVRRTAASDDWGQAPVAFSTSADDLFGTLDGGRSWQALGSDALGRAERVRLAPGYAQDPLAIISGERNDEAVFAWSRDHGRTWSEGRRTQNCGARGTAISFSQAWIDDGTAWASCYGRGVVYRTQDRGQSWQAIATMGSAVYGLASPPEGSKVFVASLDGLFEVSQHADPREVAFQGQPVFDVALSPDWQADPTLFALLASGGWFRSEDGGESWHALARPTEDVPRALALSPDFAQDDTLAVGGYGGAWVSRDRGETWDFIHALQWYEEDNPAWLHGWDWVQEEQDEQGWLRALEPGAQLELRFRGVGVELLAFFDQNGGGLQVTSDDQQVWYASLQGQSGEAREALVIEDLEDRWHELSITALEGGERLDAARIWRLTLAQEEETPSQEGCQGCAAGPRARGLAWLVLGLCLVPLVSGRRAQIYKPGRPRAPKSASASRMLS